MPLSVGDKLGPYEILAPIGAGGMGEVYKARDTRLDRIVAIKVSKTEFSERFEREARAVAALNHSNICTLLLLDPKLWLSRRHQTIQFLAPVEDHPYFPWNRPNIPANHQNALSIGSRIVTVPEEIIRRAIE